MEVICLEDSAFYQLIEEVVERLGEKKGKFQEPWVTPERAMEILNIKSKSTLQKLRDEGAITYSQPQRRVILYKYDSLIAYLETHSKKTF